MRTVSGTLLIPNDFDQPQLLLVTIEVRNVSRLDVASTVLASTEMTNVEIPASRSIAFSLEVPEVPSSESLAMRVHVSRDGSGRMQEGDLLTTQHYGVASQGSDHTSELRLVRI